MKPTLRCRLSPQPRCPHGLTLLEVLVATAILAMLAAACVPIIARAMALLGESPRTGTLQIADLAQVADAFVAHPDRFGYANAPLDAIDHLQIVAPAPANVNEQTTPEHLTLPITVSALRSADKRADHLWLRFECEGLSLTRWITIPKPADQEKPTP